MNFVLIHVRSYFGAWCWDLVTPELERLGHRVTAIDLPISERGLGASLKSASPSTVVRSPKSSSSKITPRSGSSAMTASMPVTDQPAIAFVAVPAGGLA